MKKHLALALALILTLGLCGPVLAAEAVTPTPPEWINAEDYLIFPGDEVYEPENWAKVEAIREEARNGGNTPIDESKKWPTGSAGAWYETALARIKYALNAGAGTYKSRKTFLSAAEAFRKAASAWYKHCGDKWDETYYRLQLEALRAEALHEADYYEYNWKSTLSRVLEKLDLTTEDFFAGQYMYLLTPEELETLRARVEAIDLGVDGYKVQLDVPPEVKNQRTMVPIRAVAEAIGADVAWVQEGQKIVMTRAGSTVTMTLDSTTADIDGKKVEMDVAPYAHDGRTLVPARYVAEFFGQKVEWNGEEKQVLITEDKSVVGNSNLEAWALPMGAMLNYMNGGFSPNRFGPDHRTREKTESERSSLASGWNIQNREDLINTVISMTLYGHDATFREMAADVKQRTPEERAAISAASDAWPDYMWEYTEQLDKKWGDKGIMAWDLFRMSNLVQWGYTAGYVTYAEALELLEPAATILCENFSSWDEAYENYLDGYHWWARENVLGKDIEETERGMRYRNMRSFRDLIPVFDDTLFTTGVIPLPDKEG